MRIVKKITGIFLIVVGLGFYAYPWITTEYITHQTTEYIREFENKWENTTKEDAVYAKVQKYNREIYASGQKGFCDAWSYQQSPVSLDGFQDDKFGYISIPAMDVKLPLYLGASSDNLRKGAAVLGQTSIPIGGRNTNSVIAAHRGYQGIPFFREIEKLKKGDKVKIRNPWETLTYTVVSTAVIDPHDHDAVMIREGQDMITLITCHPYRSHGKYRYVVYCTRKGKKNKKMPVEDTSEQISFQPSQADIERDKNFRYIGLIIIAVMLLYLIIIKKKRR